MTADHSILADTFLQLPQTQFESAFHHPVSISTDPTDRILLRTAPMNRTLMALGFRGRMLHRRFAIRSGFDRLERFELTSLNDSGCPWLAAMPSLPVAFIAASPGTLKNSKRLRPFV
jgi:hypothetical protein